MVDFSDGTPGGRRGTAFFDKVRAAVNRRTALLVVGALALQVAFVTSYIGAFHHPTPHRIPMAVTTPSTEITDEAFFRLALLPGEPLAPRRVSGEAVAREQIESREVDGALVLSPTGTSDTLLVAGGAGGALSEALIELVTAAGSTDGRTVRVVDVVPIPSATGDERGLSLFYLVVGWCAGGYLCGAILAISAGARPANKARASIRLGVLMAYAAAAGLLGAVVSGPVLGAQPGSVWPLWGLGALVVFAVGAVTLALQELAGVAGLGLAVLVAVILGNPSTGGVYAYPLLPPFWRTIGPVLPPGAGTYAARSIVYFQGNGAGGPVLVLAAWAVGGALMTSVCAASRRGRSATRR